MPPPESRNEASVQHIVLNEKLIKIAKEACRRHDVLAAKLKKSCDPTFALFRVTGLEKAKGLEHLVCELWARSNPAVIDQILKHFKSRVENKMDFALKSLRLTESDNWKKKCKLLHVKLTLIYKELAAEKNRADKMLDTLRHQSERQSWGVVAGVWNVLNETLFVVDGLASEFEDSINNAGFFFAFKKLWFANELYEQMIPVTGQIKVISELYSWLFPTKQSHSFPVSRVESVVQISLEFFLINWVVGFSKRIVDIIDPTCQYSVTIAEVELISKYCQSFTLVSTLDYDLSSDDSTTQNKLCEIDEPLRNLIVVQAEFCNQMWLLINPKTSGKPKSNDTAPGATEGAANAPFERILTSSHQILQEISNARAESRLGFEKLGTGLESVAKGNFELRHAKERLEKMQADGLFAFTKLVDAKDFKIICTILAEGDVAKASRKLGMRDTTLRSQINGWKGRGKAYKFMSDLVSWSKSIKRTEEIRLNDSILVEKSTSVDHPGLLSDVLDELLSMDEENWQATVEGLAELLRPHVPR